MRILLNREGCIPLAFGLAMSACSPGFADCKETRTCPVRDRGPDAAIDAGDDVVTGSTRSGGAGSGGVPNANGGHAGIDNGSGGTNGSGGERLDAGPDSPDGNDGGKSCACGPNQSCTGAGGCSVCKSDSACGESCEPCSLPTSRCLDEGQSSACVGCLGNADCEPEKVCATEKNHSCVECLNFLQCSGSTPICVSATNKCVQCVDGADCTSGQCDRVANTCDGLSCKGLSKTCGPRKTANCCASSRIPAGSFFRSYDAATYTDKGFPATISEFRLDNYEVTVGRFRKFLAAYPGNKPKPGDGKNPSNPSDTGWDSAWDAYLSTDANALEKAVNCQPGAQTWTDVSGSREALPMGCLTWYEAFVFCVWDGGRLPTEAEWNYAAVGGSEQRVYPWSSPPTNALIDCARANYYGAANGTDFCVSPGMGAAAPVGNLSPLGDARWGPSDMAGNVWEWMLDWYVSPYPQVTCVNCANTVSLSRNRTIRGGAYGEYPQDLLPSARNGSVLPADRYANVGARCARAR